MYQNVMWRNETDHDRIEQDIPVEAGKPRWGDPRHKAVSLVFGTAKDLFGPSCANTGVARVMGLT